MFGVASAPRRWCVGEVGYGVERCHSRAVMGWNGILLGDGGRHVSRGWRWMLGWVLLTLRARVEKATTCFGRGVVEISSD